jgi:hypothetical protein
VTRKTTIALLRLLLFFVSSQGFAEVLHWPQFCSGGELLIKNKTNYDFSIWLQKFDTQLLSEEEYELKSGLTSTLPLETTAENERYSLLNFNSSKDLDIKYKCGDAVYPTNAIEGGSFTFKKSDLPTNKIWLQNLYSDDNKVEIEFQNRLFQKVGATSLQLKNAEARTLVIGEGLSNWSYFKVTASNKISVFNILKSGVESPVLTQPQTTVVDTQGFYFLVGPRSGISDSFVVKITDPNLADKARELITSQKEKMLFARVQKNHQGFNRNWNSPEKSLWSWSTSEVTSFGDLGSTACNGTPQQVEDRVDAWMNDPGQICFWNYRVKKELTPNEVATGVSKSKATLKLRKPASLRAH